MIVTTSWGPCSSVVIPHLGCAINERSVPALCGFALATGVRSRAPRSGLIRDSIPELLRLQQFKNQLRDRMLIFPSCIETARLLQLQQIGLNAQIGTLSGPRATT